MDFFEIDEAVIRIACDPRYFTYLSEARSRPGVSIRTLAVDGRMGLRDRPDRSYDLIVLDAFSSDAIPTHLVTREALRTYLSRLGARGLVAFHISSRFFDLRPVLARLASEAGLVGYIREDLAVAPERAAEAMRPSVWVVLARDRRDLGQLAEAAPRWQPLAARPDAPLWTDDYAPLLAILER
jgi:spermidine synthase